MTSYPRRMRTLLATRPSISKSPRLTRSYLTSAARFHRQLISALTRAANVQLSLRLLEASNPWLLVVTTLTLSPFPYPVMSRKHSRPTAYDVSFGPEEGHSAGRLSQASTFSGSASSSGTRRRRESTGQSSQVRIHALPKTHIC